MPVDEKTRQAIDVKNLPPSPRNLPVVRLDVEDYTDADGDPALRVTVILDESADPEHIDGGEVGAYKLAIRDALRKSGVTVFPYIWFAKQSELDETDEE